MPSAPTGAAFSSCCSPWSRRPAARRRHPCWFICRGLTRNPFAPRRCWSCTRPGFVSARRWPPWSPRRPSAAFPRSGSRPFSATTPIRLAGADAWLAASLDARSGELAGILRSLSLTALVDDLFAAGAVADRLDDPGNESVLWEHMQAATGMPPDWPAVFAQVAGAKAADIAFVVAGWALCVEYVHDLNRPPVDPRLEPTLGLPAPLVDACRQLCVHLRARHPGFYLWRSRTIPRAGLRTRRARPVPRIWAAPTPSASRRRRSSRRPSPPWPRIAGRRCSTGRNLGWKATTSGSNGTRRGSPPGGWCRPRHAWARRSNGPGRRSSLPKTWRQPSSAIVSRVSRSTRPTGTWSNAASRSSIRRSPTSMSFGRDLTGLSACGATGRMSGHWISMPCVCPRASFQSRGCSSGPCFGRSWSR